ncbi:MAG: hypothetical protein CYPHOPRED_002700 [Cyphobasidiales sp. Tagirdzhanova-0007]|nr:MAG: hypothetical protein CYPHOPRED_002700 [Cyphobasidiales sp. Tagirdzhanova-0007]
MQATVDVGNVGKPNEKRGKLEQKQDTKEEYGVKVERLGYTQSVVLLQVAPLTPLHEIVKMLSSVLSLPSITIIPHKLNPRLMALKLNAPHEFLRDPPITSVRGMEFINQEVVIITLDKQTPPLRRHSKRLLSACGLGRTSSKICPNNHAVSRANHCKDLPIIVLKVNVKNITAVIFWGDRIKAYSAESGNFVLQATLSGLNEGWYASADHKKWFLTGCERCTGAGYTVMA